MRNGNIPQSRGDILLMFSGRTSVSASQNRHRPFFFTDVKRPFLLQKSITSLNNTFDRPKLDFLRHLLHQIVALPLSNSAREFILSHFRQILT